MPEQDDGEVPHKLDAGQELEKIDTAEWVITNRMVDVDTDELLYRLREIDGGAFTETEIMTEPQVFRSYKIGGEESAE